jgi:dolichol kinase
MYFSVTQKHEFSRIIKLKYHVNNVINKMDDIKKSRQLFFVNIKSLFLSIYGHINFLQLQCFNGADEQTILKQFEKFFDFLKFNLELVKEYGGVHYSSGFVLAILVSQVNPLQF